MKIAEGCDKHCTYCIIPKVRGNYRSVPMEQLLQEARELAEGGVKELILVAQETTVIRKGPLWREISASAFSVNLCKIDGIAAGSVFCTVIRKRLMMNLIEVMKEEKKICHYLDLPIQHAKR